MARTLLYVRPADLREGDEIVNVGVVSALRTEGVMTTAEATAMVWSTVTGRGREAKITTVFHNADEVVITRQEPTEGTPATHVRVIAGSLA